MQRFIQNTDPAAQQLIGRYALECGLAGGLIDDGNAFLNLNSQRRAALELYIKGEAPKGWWQHLPRPVQSVFSETTWTIIEKIVDAVMVHGLPAVIPAAGIVVGSARVVLEIREKRVEELLAYRRSDVDELLDLVDQLTKASGKAQRLLDSINGVARAADPKNREGQ